MYVYINIWMGFRVEGLGSGVQGFRVMQGLHTG